MSAPLDLSNPQRKLHVGVILMDSVTEILDVAPIDMFSGLGKEFTADLPEEMFPAAMKAQAFEIEFHWVSQHGPSKIVKLTSGINLQPTDSFETCHPLDIVLIGAHIVSYVPNETELAYVRKAYEECSAFLTICGGVDVPLRAGLLEGRTATGPRPFLPVLRKQSPGTNWVEKRWVRDGKLWTSGALLNGTDMMAAVAKEFWVKEEGCLADMAIKMGAWPQRDVEYKDVPWAV